MAGVVANLYAVLACALASVFGGSAPTGLRIALLACARFCRFAAVGSQSVAVVSSGFTVAVAARFRSEARLAVGTCFSACAAVGGTRLEVDACTVTQGVVVAADERTFAFCAGFARGTLVEACATVVDVRQDVCLFAKAHDYMRRGTFAPFADLAIVACIAA